MNTEVFDIHPIKSSNLTGKYAAFGKGYLLMDEPLLPLKKSIDKSEDWEKNLACPALNLDDCIEAIN